MSAPGNFNDLAAIITDCYDNIDLVRRQLEEKIPVIKKQAEDIFEDIRKICVNKK